MTDTLFPTLDEPPIPAPTPEAGPFAGIALEQSIDRVLDYAVGPKLLTSIHVGQRVRVPLGRGNKPAHGYVVSIQPTTAHPKVKRILSIEDDRVLVIPKLMELARWMSRYYITPLGIVLDSVIPSAVKKRIGIGYSQIVRLAWAPEKIQELLEKTKARKRRAILARLLQLPADQSIELIRLAGEAGVTPPTVRKLAVGGLITIRPEVDLPRLTEDIPVGRADEADIALNADQQKVFDALRPRLSSGGFSINLIHGVTGSGKTEVYLQSIREIISRKKQALVLVPEIALTPQTVHRFMARFPRVAILHSGLSATQRHKYWQQITQGEADVVVGARSAIFAPLPNLGVIVVDEEHDSSYKQDQAPRYNGRDVAIKRAQLEDIPVILGSATPSLESYYRATTAALKSPAENRYPLYELPNRVRGLAMPAVELVDMRTDQRHRRGVHLISVRLEHLLKATLESKRQAILLLNRRGYSNFVYCAFCAEPIHCRYCDTTMTYHRSAEAHAHGASSAEGIHTGQLHCHYCLAVNPLPDKCPTCGKKLILFGLGTQRVEEEFARKFPECKFARVDSDSMRSSKDYEQLLTRFAKNEVQVMLGTQMIAKGLDYPNVTLVGVISGDTALSLPDFRAAERTFQLITQVAGRAGRGDSPGRVIVQTYMPDDPTIRAALKHDYAGFAASELKNRQQCALPPFSRMVRIILRDQDSAQLTLHSQELATLLESAVQSANVPVKTRGPMPCPINRIAGYFRNQIILTAPTPEPLQQILATVRASGGLAKSDRIAVDVNPVSLL